jgi:glycosyltransferase involved in cell wall biosynthesis
VQSLVTVVLTYYNQRKSLEKNLPLWLDQWAKVVVSDDGSKDNARDICEKHGVAYHWQEDEDNRQSEAFQRGLEMVDTMFVVFTDADAIPCTGYIGKMLQAWEPKRMCIGPREFKKDGVWVRDWRQEFIDPGFDPTCWKFGIGCNMFGATKAFIDNGGWDINYRGYGLLD